MTTPDLLCKHRCAIHVCGTGATRLWHSCLQLRLFTALDILAQQEAHQQAAAAITAALKGAESEYWETGAEGADGAGALPCVSYLPAIRVCS